MRKKLLFACLFVMASLITYAQKPTVDRSPAFEEPENGASRLLLMKNGNTLFFHFTPKKGIDVTVYDTKHHAKAVVNNQVKSWKPKAMKTAELEGLYEINGQAVVFIQQIVEKRPCLYRLSFDSKSGKLVEEKLVANLERMSMGKGYAMMFGGVAKPDFYVRKDPNSEYYAVAVFNSFAHESGERIQIIHYAPNHKEISKAYYESPKGTYKYLNFQDMYVNKDEFVFVTTFAFNTRSSGGKDSRILISRLMKGAKEFEYNLLDYTDDYRDIDVAIKYNSNNNLLYMGTSISAKSVDKDETMHRDGKAGKFVLEMNIIDPVALKVKEHFMVNHPDLNEYAKMHLRYKKPYYGAIQDFRINSDNTISLLFEEIDIIVHTHNSMPVGGLSTVGPSNGGGVVMHSSYSSTTTYTTRLGEIGIAQIDQSGKEISSYAIPKRQYADAKLDMWYQFQRPFYDWTFRGKKFANNYNNIAGFFSYDYVFANNTGYVLYNDYVGNVESDDENYRKKKKMRYISDANTIYAVYDGKEVTKGYLFGEPSSRKESRFCQLEMNTHSEDGKSFATMMIEKQGRDKQAYIVWVTM
jgi:hypothetical protein